MSTANEYIHEVLRIDIQQFCELYKKINFLSSRRTNSPSLIP